MSEIDPKHLMLDWLRQSAPVHRDESSGCFFLTRYADVRSVMLDRHSKDSDLAEKGSFLEKAGRPVNPHRPDERDMSMGYLDDPDHARVRQPVAQAFARKFAGCRPLLERVVAQHLIELARRDVVDVVSDYAIPVPLKANALLIGVEQEDLPQFRDWALAGFKIFQTERSEQETRDMNDALEGFARYFEDLIARRRLAPRDDLVSDLISLQAGGADLSDHEIRCNCVSLLAASIMTTTDLIGSAIRLLILHPQQLRLVQNDPDLIGRAIEEAVRLEPPVESEWRVMSRDVEVGGCPVKRGQVVSVSLLGANRDPAIFVDPHAFDVLRDPQSNMSFGGGEHICIGAPLGRLEAQIAVGRFFATFPGAAMVDPNAAPKRRPTPYFPGLAELMVRPRATARQLEESCHGN